MAQILKPLGGGLGRCTCWVRINRVGFTFDICLLQARAAASGVSESAAICGLLVGMAQRDTKASMQCAALTVVLEGHQRGLSAATLSFCLLHYPANQPAVSIHMNNAGLPVCRVACGRRCCSACWPSSCAWMPRLRWRAAMQARHLAAPLSFCSA